MSDKPETSIASVFDSIYGSQLTAQERSVIKALEEREAVEVGRLLHLVHGGHTSFIKRCKDAEEERDRLALALSEANRLVGKLRAARGSFLVERDAALAKLAEATERFLEAELAALSERDAWREKAEEARKMAVRVAKAVAGMQADEEAAERDGKWVEVEIVSEKNNDEAYAAASLVLAESWAK